MFRVSKLLSPHPVSSSAFQKHNVKLFSNGTTTTTTPEISDVLIKKKLVEATFLISEINGMLLARKKIASSYGYYEKNNSVVDKFCEWVNSVVSYSENQQKEAALESTLALLSDIESNMDSSLAKVEHMISSLSHQNKVKQFNNGGGLDKVTHQSEE